MVYTNLLRQKTLCRMTNEEIFLLHLLLLGLVEKVEECKACMMLWNVC